MIIVDRKTFLDMPAETVFSFYEPCIFSGPAIKGKTLFSDGEAIDFFYTNEFAGPIDAMSSGDEAEMLFDAQRNGTSLPLCFDTLQRDGCFDHDQLYAVYERRDVEALIERLKKTLQ